MSWIAVAAAGGAIVSGVVGSNASKSAADSQAQSANQAAQLQQDQFNQTRNDLAPLRTIGGQALNRLNDTTNNFDSAAYLAANPAVGAAGIDPYQHYQMYGKAEGRTATPYNAFSASPDYGFRRSEGMRGIEQTNAARGTGQSGNALKALADFNSNLASSEYGNWWNRQAGLAGVGQAATTQTGQFGAQAAGNVGNALMQGGDARASGIMGGANSWAGGINSGINNYLLARGGYFGKPAASAGGGMAQGSWLNNYGTGWMGG